MFFFLFFDPRHIFPSLGIDGHATPQATSLCCIPMVIFGDWRQSTNLICKEDISMVLHMHSKGVKGIISKSSSSNEDDAQKGF